MAGVPQILNYQGVPFWRHLLIIQWAAQIVSGVVVVALVVWFFANIGNAIQERDIPYGFSFLSREYQTPIGDSPVLPYESSDTFHYALWVGITNTLVVAIAGVILATILGIFIGVCRLSGNWIVSKLALGYVEFFRNVPLLVQLLFWFFHFPDAAAGAARVRHRRAHLRQQPGHIYALASGIRCRRRRNLGGGGGGGNHCGRFSEPMDGPAGAGYRQGVLSADCGLVGGHWGWVGSVAGVELRYRRLAFFRIDAGTAGAVWADNRGFHGAGRAAGVADWTGDVYRGVYRRNRPGGDSVGRTGQTEAARALGLSPMKLAAKGYLSASAAGYHTAADKPNA